MSPTRTRIGLQIPYFNLPGVEPAGLLDKLTEIVTTAEAAGFDSVWVMDHLNQLPGQGPMTDWMLEGNVALAALAARTTTVHLGLMVGGVTYRNPSLMAKATTSIDVLSGGRAVLGIGAAWFEPEHVAFGYDFPPIAERFERLEDALRISRAMFTQDRATVAGTHHSIEDCINSPQPIRGDIPILIGGNGERKTLRLVAQYADASNLVGDPAEVPRLLGVLERHCDSVGRDPAEITKTKLATLVIGPTAAEAEQRIAVARERMSERAASMMVAGDPDSVGAQVASLRAAGLDGIIVNMPRVYDLEEVDLAGRTLAAAVGA